MWILAGAVLVDQGLSGFLYTLAAGALLAAFLLALHNLVWGDDKD